MKRLYLIRHAETESFTVSGRDRDRQLTANGIRDAKNMSALFHLDHINLDEIYFSGVTRTMQTATIFADTLMIEKKRIKPVLQLYGASVFDFYSVIERIPDRVNSMAIFSHNPGISDFANDLGCQQHIHFSPCCCLAVQVNTDKWVEFQIAKKEFLFFRSPDDTNGD